MGDIFTLGNLFTLFMLIMLQAVLGFDNLLYISLESKKAPEADQKRVRKLGILIAIVLRVILLFILVKVISFFQSPISFLTGEIEDVAYFQFTGHSIIVLLGGGFILYTAVKEIWHMISGIHEEGSEAKEERKKRTANSVIISIVIMNLVFSFDSILAAIGLTSDIAKNSEITAFVIMAIAIIGSGMLMLLLADKVSDFLNKNRMYEVLGLFILFIVGIMLLTEGAHLAHLSFFGNEIHPMSQTTFYFVIAVLIVVDIVQTRYQKKIIAEAKKIKD